jgi:hypothetical protein
VRPGCVIRGDGIPPALPIRRRYPTVWCILWAFGHVVLVLMDGRSGVPWYGKVDGVIGVVRFEGEFTVKPDL